MNKSFNSNSYFAINNQYGTTTYICPNKNNTKTKQICYQETCCNYIYRNPKPIILPFSAFVMTFIYNSSERFPINLFNQLIPILSSDEYITYAYTLEPAVPVINNLVTLTVHFKFIENEFTTDGLYFKPASKTFWNNLTTNINIIKFGKIPLSRTDGQFSDLTDITFTAPDYPTIYTNTTLHNCFKNCINFNSYIGDWDTTNVTDMSYMFYDCQKFNQSLITWNTSNVTNMSFMFYNNVNFNQPLTTWNTSNVTNMSYMFNYATIFNQNIDNFNISNVTNITGMFSHAYAFNNGDIGNLKTKPLKFVFNPNLTSLESLFESATSFNQNIAFDQINNYWNTSNITNMASLFQNASIFNFQLNWNTSNVTNMNSMFFCATQFNNGDLTNVASKPFLLKTSNVTDMGFMFFNATNFNQVLPTIPDFPLNEVTFDVSKVFYIEHIFESATKFNNGDTENNYNNPFKLQLNFGLKSLAYMFADASSFNQDISNYSNYSNTYWDTLDVTNMNYTFYNASVFNNGQNPPDPDPPYTIYNTQPMRWPISVEIQDLVSDPLNPDNKAPFNFSVGSVLSLYESPGPPIIGNSPFKYDGAPTIPTLNYANYGDIWTKLDYQPTPNGNNWIDIAINYDGTYILVIAYTPSSIWSEPGFYVSNDRGNLNSWKYIGGYKFNGIFYSFTNSKFYSCSVSRTGQYQAVMVKPGEDGEENTNYLYLSSDYGVNWIKQSIPAIVGFNDISALCMSGSGEFIYCGNLGVGTSTVYTVGKNYGTIWNYYKLSTTQLATIYSIATNITGKYVAAYCAGPSGYNAIAVSHNYGSTWPYIKEFTGNLGNFLNNDYKHMLCMSGDGQYILFSAGNNSYVSTNFGDSFTIITTTLGFLSTTVFNGNYSLVSSSSNNILINKNFGAGAWNPSNATFIQPPNGLCTSYYGEYSFAIINNVNNFYNGIYYNRIYPPT